jgi:uncharacterized damage-inducible protein DinB
MPCQCNFLKRAKDIWPLFLQFRQRMFTFTAMKSYFIRLFNYDQFANRQIAGLILSTPKNQQAINLMAHTLAAQQRWLSRCKLEAPSTDPLWPEGNADDLMELIDSSHGAWLTYLQTLQPEDFEKPVTYQNMQGVTYTDTLQDILAHVINHGTHHRAQAGQHLKLAGAALPILDYIFYARELTSTP